MADRKAVVKNADMSEDMQQDAIDISTQALEKFNIEKDIAAFIKKEFDKKYNPTWHCIVGRNFGSYVTHETKHFIYFYLGQVAILLFKSGWDLTPDLKSIGWCTIYMKAIHRFIHLTSKHHNNKILLIVGADFAGSINTKWKILRRLYQTEIHLETKLITAKLFEPDPSLSLKS